MLDAPWKRPVRAAGRAIRTPLEAIHFMDHGWPQKKSLLFAQAHETCLAALDGRDSADHARLLFAEAVDEAQLH
ncbi:DUF982 domain-containing protein [Rhizobium sp. SSA_523]|uniref:DUF982 domain-containing protein n=1 Tax=Rhizobium sp. SSA_523 TaxID=2952477 RepID=UPI0020910D28|nr:DUF982 domain-containing protein [Rhizobium sp. SSA_523]MCO5730214.1 DUF982 domain-containing protein [Rhizobium sp. SSA_523]WKC25274.1 DUF982 domain-containing protein [Rhizobium sp. SSA_523]